MSTCCFTKLVSFIGHISGSSSKTAGAGNGVFLPRINREKVKFYADTDNIFEVAVLRIHSNTY